MCRSCHWHPQLTNLLLDEIDLSWSNLEAVLRRFSQTLQSLAIQLPEPTRHEIIDYLDRLRDLVILSTPATTSILKLFGRSPLNHISLTACPNFRFTEIKDILTAVTFPHLRYLAMQISTGSQGDGIRLKELQQGCDMRNIALDAR